MSDDAVKCEKCGLEITTGLMAGLCQYATECPMWPHSDGTPSGDGGELFMARVWMDNACKQIGLQIDERKRVEAYAEKLRAELAKHAITWNVDGDPPERQGHICLICTGHGWKPDAIDHTADCVLKNPNPTATPNPHGSATGHVGTATEAVGVVGTCVHEINRSSLDEYLSAMCSCEPEVGFRCMACRGLEELDALRHQARQSQIVAALEASLRRRADALLASGYVDFEDLGAHYKGIADELHAAIRSPQVCRDKDEEPTL